jgi:hypothetical protein
VAWTSTGVTERANGEGKSCYYYTATLETAHSYQVDWKDNSSPVKTAGEIIPENSISTVTVATNLDKTGYTASSVTDKTGYALTGDYDAAKTAASQASVSAIPTNPTLQTTWTDTKAGYIDAAISSRSTYAGGAVASVTAAVDINSNSDITAIKTKTDNLPTDPADDSDIDTQLAAVQADLDNPSQYKADVSALALDSTVAKEATLANATYGLSALQVLLDAIATSTELQAMFDEIKGVGWTTETLKAIYDLGGGGLTAQQVRDAMQLAPTTDSPATGSVDKQIDDIETQTDKMRFNNFNDIWCITHGGQH